MFFRKPRIEALEITMTGVRMGDRLLQIGVDDPGLVGALASRVGLSGFAALAVDSERDAARAQRAVQDAGAFVEVKVTPLRTLPFDSGSFDLIVVHGMRGRLAAMTAEDRVGSLRESLRVLRGGGRLVVIESAPREGLARLLRPHTEDEHYGKAGGAVGALKAEGFGPVRLLGEREGYRFTEGLKT